jgi:hypothetical protein
MRIPSEKHSVPGLGSTSVRRLKNSYKIHYINQKYGRNPPTLELNVEMKQLVGTIAKASWMNVVP